MITGFNTDIDYHGRVYHVQTEDRGLGNPIIETMVYCGGEIVASRKSPYADLVASGTYSEEGLLKRMDAQHRELMREIRSGKFEGDDERKPFGHGTVTNRSFDEVVLTFLSEKLRVEQIKLDVKGPRYLEEGKRQTLKLRVVERASGRPVAGARVEVRLVAEDAPSQELFSAPTDETGRVEAAFEIPAQSGDGAVILWSVDAAGRTAGQKRYVRRRPSISAHHP